MAAPAAAAETEAASQRTVIEIRDLSFSYPTKPDVLHNVSFDIRTGELLAIVGQNGSGKSTLAAQLNGILRPTSGEVRVDGKPTTSYKVAALAKRVAYIFQVPEKQFITNTVYDEMAHSLRAMRIDDAQIKERVATVLEHIGLSGRERMTSGADRPAGGRECTRGVTLGAGRPACGRKCTTRWAGGQAQFHTMEPALPVNCRIK